jgi:hypothetical protein
MRIATWMLSLKEVVKSMSFNGLIKGAQFSAPFGLNSYKMRKYQLT